MKRIFVLALSAAMLAGTASAQTVNSNSGSNSNANAGSSSGVSISSRSAKNASSAIAPGLIASGLSCSGSAAAGGAGGGWGFSLGITKPDDNCDAREDAKYMQGVTGDIGAAKERLCDNSKIRAAYARAGRPCAADVRYVAQRQPTRTYNTGSARSANAGNIKLANCERRAANDPSVNCAVYR